MEKSLSKKVILIGTGFVGMSYVYAMLNQGTSVDELVLIDVNKDKAVGEAMDLNHGLAFAPKKMKISAGDYSDCADADIIVIAAGANQEVGETRLDLIAKNYKVFDSIISNIMKYNFKGIFLIATNPVDIMTYITWKISGFEPNRVIGSGTTLDTARLRYEISRKINIDPRNVHAYVMGEHGDSEFVPWSHVTVGVKPILNVLKSMNLNKNEFDEIADSVKNAAYEIIKRKRATYYGIGMALTRVTNAILNNENSILTVSSYLNGEYGHKDIYIGVPAVVNRDGVHHVVELELTAEEQGLMNNSVRILKENLPK